MECSDFMQQLRSFKPQSLGCAVARRKSSTTLIFPLPPQACSGNSESRLGFISGESFEFDFGIWNIRMLKILASIVFHVRIRTQSYLVKLIVRTDGDDITSYETHMPVRNRSFIDVLFSSLIDMEYLYEQDLLNRTSINSRKFFDGIKFGTMQYVEEFCDVRTKPAHSKLERQALNLYFVWCSTYSEWTVVTPTVKPKR